MEKQYMLSFDEKELFNNKLTQQYDEDGQKGFLGYLLRYKQWKLNENKIVFPDVKTNEQVNELLKEYNRETLKDYLKIQRGILDKVAIFGVTNLEQMIKKKYAEIIKEEKRTKQKER